MPEEFRVVAHAPADACESVDVLVRYREVERFPAGSPASDST